jgi:dienelactone hydrolase
MRHCPLSAPRIGGTADTDALAGAPAQCGQAAYAWLRSPRLGEISDPAMREDVDAATARALLALGKVPLPDTVHDVAIEQISYTTQDRGALLAATGLLAYPTDMPGGSVDVLLVLHGTAGFTDQCAPSNAKDSRTLVSALAALGYAVVAPDYIGLRATGGPTGFLHPYLAGQPTAIASLDAVRAAARRLARPDSPVCAGTRFATVGGSQGGHAALWVDRLWPYYAPELTLVGVVATVPPADLVGESLRALSSTVPASANMAAFFAATSDWYGVTQRLGEVFLSPLDKDLPAALAQSCNPGDQLKNKMIGEVFQPALLTAAKQPDTLRALLPWGCMIGENGLTTTAVRRIAPAASSYGILYVLGESDMLVNPDIERQGFDTLCTQGMRMQYLECAGASHTQTTTWALPELVQFVGDRFAGKAMPADKVCVRAAATRCSATP